jgi:hypothetical protein
MNNPMKARPTIWTPETITAKLQELAVDGFAPTATQLIAQHAGLLTAIYRYTPGYYQAVQAAGLKCKRGPSGSVKAKRNLFRRSSSNPNRPCDHPVLTRYALNLVHGKNLSDRLNARFAR